MSRLGQEIDRLILDLAWSLWAELGIDGGMRRHDWQAIDLEPLIIFTARLGTVDSRLRASSIDWCITNARFASAYRLRNLADRASGATRSAFGHFAATVRAHARVPWPGEGDPLTMLHPDRCGSPDLRRPSLVQLRLRALVGVSARAEILKLMLAEPDRPQSAAALADDAAYGKGSVVQALDMLTLAGIVQVQPDANRLLYRLSRPGELAQTLQWLPSVFPDWWPILRITEGIADYARSASGSPTRRLENLRQFHELFKTDLHRLDVALQVSPAPGAASVAEFEHWALAFLADQAGRAEVASAAREIAFSIHHLTFGGWIGTVSTAGHDPEPLHPDQGQLEERPGASTLSLQMFKTVLQTSARRATTNASEDPLVNLLSREFAEELMRPLRAGQEATFTAEFVRRWYENRRLRLGATA